MTDTPTPQPTPPATPPAAPAPAAPTPAQSEIGPTTYGGPKGPVPHGADDPETKTAYAAGHPAHGLEHQRAATKEPTPPASGDPAKQG